MSPIRVGATTVTTTRLVKAGTFDIDLDGIASTEVELVPQSLVGTGYTATGWGCRAAGADLVAGAAIPAGESWFPPRQSGRPDGRHRGDRQRQRRGVVHAPGDP